jgi:UDP-2,4-diacetamido-2,4,6-trideoxy-beta-L-altropyranose hydrolase
MAEIFYHVVFRCDASLQIGSGHVMRCRALARTLQRRGAEVVFLCRRQPGDLIALLEEEFRVLVLPESALIAEAIMKDSPLLSGRDLYASWLGLSEEQDAQDSLSALVDHTLLEPVAWLVLDHYGLGAPWEKRLRDGLHLAHGSVPQILVIDDLADRSHQASVLIDTNKLDPAAPDPYRDLLPETGKTLLGPAYALLDPHYTQLQPLLPARSNLLRVLVFYGGVDADNHTAIALEALSHPRLLDIAVDVVLSISSIHITDVQRRVRERANTSLHLGLPSLAGLIARADLALGAAGTTSWERACLGLPCLVMPVAENQEQGARAQEAAGIARCLNLQPAEDPVATMQRALLQLLDSPIDLQAMSEACFQLGDGRGLARVATALLGPAPGLHLRSAKAADLLLYHRWASDPQVRQQSFTSDPIPMPQHRPWFTSRLGSPLALLRVLEDGNGLPLGQIRFERAAETATRAVVSFSLDNIVRGKGLAPLLLRLGLEELARCWGNSCEAYGEVCSHNQASSRAFLRADFQEGPPPRPGVRCFARTPCSVN